MPAQRRSGREADALRIRGAQWAGATISAAAAKRTPSGIFARPDSGASRIPVLRTTREETRSLEGLGVR